MCSMTFLPMKLTARSGVHLLYIFIVYKVFTRGVMKVSPSS